MEQQKKYCLSAAIVLVVEDLTSVEIGMSKEQGSYRCVQCRFLSILSVLHIENRSISLPKTFHWVT